MTAGDASIGFEAPPTKCRVFAWEGGFMSGPVVVGGGLAGLACARELGEGCLLIEAEDRLGGLCRTDIVQGFSFDWTGHWLHARDPEMRALIAERWLRGNRLEVSWLSGGVVELGREVGIQTPLNRAVAAILSVHADGRLDH